MNYRLPAEWEPHTATWISWPHNREDWPGKFTPIASVYADIVRKLSRVERVRILVHDDSVQKKARHALRQAGVDLGQVDFHEVPTDRSWTRDFCPIFVTNAAGEKAATDWRFNGWAKYEDHKRDDAATELLAAREGWARIAPEAGGRRIVLEGGSIDQNGRGLLLTTEECLLSPVQARNPGMSREELERVFGEYFGISKTLWLRNGIAGDDTHGHVDDLARFVDERTIVIVTEPDPTDANHEPLAENLALAREMTDQTGVALRVETLPMPEPVYYAGQRLPASYANFYIANGLVLVPTFNDANDRIALNTLAELFPARQVVGVHCLDLVLGLGTLHCMTQQEP